MDLLVLVLAMGMSAALVACIFKGRRAIWSMLGFFGLMVMALATLVLLADGDLTIVSNGSVVTLAAANGNFISDFNLMSVAPIAATVGEAWVVILRTFKR